MKQTKRKGIIYRDCPLCKGTGLVVKRNNAYSSEQRQKARDLYAKGITLRAIGKEIGVEHPQKVKSLIMAKI